MLFKLKIMFSAAQPMLLKIKLKYLKLSMYIL
jgi:hypothetical protein